MVTIGRSGSELFKHGIYSLHPLYCACDGVEIVEQYGESRCTFSHASFVVSGSAQAGRDKVYVIQKSLSWSRQGTSFPNVLSRAGLRLTFHCLASVRVPYPYLLL